MLIFKKGGYLKPSMPISATLADLVEFVKGRNRILIWNEFSEFVKELRKICSEELVIWIDGSFVTHKRQPKDIDVVIFVHNVDLQKEQRVFYELEEYIYSSTSIDLYIVPVYSSVDPGFKTDTLPQKAYWYKLFRRVKGRRFLRKGFIEVKL